MSEDIKVENLTLYNIILCSKTHFPATKSYKSSFFVQYYHTVGFQKLKKYSGDRFDKIIVLHDPQKPSDAPNAPVPPVAEIAAEKEKTDKAAAEIASAAALAAAEKEKADKAAAVENKPEGNK